MFQKAQRKKIKLKLGMTGPSGSGKTYSALRLATGLVGPQGKIAVIDSENGSASLYSHKFNFDVLELSPPFTVEKYMEAIKAAEKAGYDILIIDQISHSWSGPGGLLEQKAVLDSRPGSNHWTNWGPITKKHEALKSAWLNSPLHVINSMRSKTEYAQSEDGGKKKIEKVGMAPIEREGSEYEYSIVFDCDMNHTAVASKDRTSLFTKRIFQITEETGLELRIWLETGGDLVGAAKPQEQAPKSDEDTIKRFVIPVGAQAGKTFVILEAEIGFHGVKDYVNNVKNYIAQNPTKVQSEMRDISLMGDLFLAWKQARSVEPTPPSEEARPSVPMSTNSATETEPAKTKTPSTPMPSETSSGGTTNKPSETTPTASQEEPNFDGEISELDALLEDVPKTFDPSKYIIKYGMKNGKRVGDFTVEQMKEYLTFLKAKADEDNSNEALIEALINVEAFVYGEGVKDVPAKKSSTAPSVSSTATSMKSAPDATPKSAGSTTTAQPSSIKNEAPPAAHEPEKKESVFMRDPEKKHATAQQLEGLMSRCNRNNIQLRHFQEFLASKGETMMSLTVGGLMAADKWIAEQKGGPRVGVPGTEQ